jgi:hypothetical protein
MQGWREKSIRKGRQEKKREVSSCPHLPEGKELLDVIDITSILFGRKAKARENF